MSIDRYKSVIDPIGNNIPFIKDEDGEWYKQKDIIKAIDHDLEIWIHYIQDCPTDDFAKGCHYALKRFKENYLEEK